jgi:hypothetical protein
VHKIAPFQHSIQNHAALIDYAPACSSDLQGAKCTKISARGSACFRKEIFAPRMARVLLTQQPEILLELRRMKAALVLSIMILAPVGHAANAAQFDSFDYSDVSVISVAPRASTVRPFVMAIFTKEQRQRIAAAAFKKSAIAAR